tara:strand:- start:680 stop:2110 length:1431 start_codon:yes stop_codon:yes gene_type:complete
MSNIIPIILCGGRGTRLWPLSRQSYPKQFLTLSGNTNKSLLQETQARISDLDEIDNPIIICNEEHRFLVAEQMRQIKVKPKAIILEPYGRNTAPAITLCAFKALEFNEDSLLVVLSADHIIKDVETFRKVLRKGFEYAYKDNLVTFGIIPNRVETGYGYIESLSKIDKNNLSASRIKKFIEKPNKELASELINSKRYTWNSGMFVFKTNLIVNEIKKYDPLIHSSCKEAISKSVQDLDFIRIDENSFAKTPDLPIDIAVMEKTDKGVVVPLDAEWSDIGSWKSLWDSEEKDLFGNSIKGKVLNQESRNCLIRSENRLLVTIGLKDLIVVETPDATLVANKNHADKLKLLVHQLEKDGYSEGAFHKKIYRPWGSYTSLIEDEGWLVKKIEVNPGSKLSLQMHNHRAEHWIVVDGIAEIQIDERNFLLQKNQSTFIPLKAKHRLINPGKTTLTLIEIQSGKYIGEDDIVRFKDEYGRG